jgi:hypothetical protein
LFDFLSEFQYEIIVSEESQRDPAKRGGLCNFHTWQYHSVASPRGSCVGLPPLLDRWAAELRNLAAVAGSAAAVSAAVGAFSPQRETCVLCRVRGAAEEEAVNSVAGRLHQKPDSTLQSLSALCLPHFRQLTAAVTNPEILGRLLARQAALLERLSEDMRRFAIKHDGLRRQLASDEETHAADRALLLLAGHRTINTPPPRQ